MAPVIHLRLYVAGGAPNSVSALGNLHALIRAMLHDRHRLEVVDVLVDPGRALKDGVLLTPTLVKIAPAPTRRIIGDLSDALKVLRALGLDPA